MGLRTPSSLFPPAVSKLTRPLSRLAVRADHPLSPNSPVKLHHLRDGMFGDTGRRNSDGTPRFHAGIDFVAAIGTRVYAVAPGRIEWIRPNVSGYGLCVLQSFRWMDGRSYFAFFAHLSSVLVKEHQIIEPGWTVIGLSGVSGLPKVRDTNAPFAIHPCSSHPHLHFEIRTLVSKIMPNPKDFREDPQKFLGFIPYQQDTIDYILYKNSIA